MLTQATMQFYGGKKSRYPHYVPRAINTMEFSTKCKECKRGVRRRIGTFVNVYSAPQCTQFFPIRVHKECVGRAWPQFSMIRMPKKVAHRACLSVQLNMHPNSFLVFLWFICPRVCRSSHHTSFVFSRGPMAVK